MKAKGKSLPRHGCAAFPPSVFRLCSRFPVFRLSPSAFCLEAIARQRVLHALRFLHHHGGAVLLVARRQRTAGRRDRAADPDGGAGVDDAAAEVLLHGVLRGVRGLRRRIRRLDAQGPRDVHHQHGEDRGLLDAVLHCLACSARHLVQRPGAVRLRGRRARRRGLFASQVRHPHRVPAAPETGRRQRLDRGADGRSPSSSAHCSAAC